MNRGWLPGRVSGRRGLRLRIQHAVLLPNAHVSLDARPAFMLACHWRRLALAMPGKMS